MEKIDITIIGAGVIGLSIAYALGKLDKDVLVIEKNSSFGQETSSRNSEVIHSGIYYPPGSMKADTCIQGRELLYDFCLKYNIDHKRSGKILAASDDEGIKKIGSIYKNAMDCGIDNLKMLDKKEIHEIEPEIQSEAAVFCPDSGIIDSHGLMKTLYGLSRDRNTVFAFGVKVTGIRKTGSGYSIAVEEPHGEYFNFNSSIVINAAGLGSEEIAALAGINTDKTRYTLHFCKGQYFRLKNPAKYPVTHLVYPPPGKTGLGIHLTPDLAGGLRLGPDSKYVQQLDYSIDERDRSVFFDSVKVFLPGLDISDLIPDTAGIRPKLQQRSEYFRDFVIIEESGKGLPGFIDLVGIESPGLTACLSIGKMVRDMVIKC